MAKISGIYKITIGDRYYIGRSTDVNGRIGQHLSRLRRGCHDNLFMQCVYDKYRSFEHAIVEECSPEDTPRAEARYLHLHSDDVLCMNLARADENGLTILPEETRRKMSEAHRGKKHSEEARKKVSDARRGKKRSEETIRKHAEAVSRPCVLCPPGELPLYFKSLTDSAEYIGVTPPAISHKLTGRSPWPKPGGRSKLAGWTGEYVR